jgi:hypothetical protein
MNASIMQHCVFFPSNAALFAKPSQAKPSLNLACFTVALTAAAG